MIARQAPKLMFRGGRRSHEARSSEGTNINWTNGHIHCAPETCVFARSSLVRQVGRTPQNPLRGRRSSWMDGTVFPHPNPSLNGRGGCVRYAMLSGQNRPVMNPRATLRKPLRGSSPDGDTARMAGLVGTLCATLLGQAGEIFDW